MGPRGRLLRRVRWRGQRELGTRPGCEGRRWGAAGERGRVEVGGWRGTHASGSRLERRTRQRGLDIGDERGGTPVPLIRVLRKRLLEDTFERGRHGGLPFPQRGERQRLLQVLHQHFDRAVAGERHLPGQHLVEDDPEGVEVGAVVGLAARLLGGHVLGRADRHPGAGERVALSSALAMPKSAR